MVNPFFVPHCGSGSENNYFTWHYLLKNQPTLKMQCITPFLWFNNNAQEAVHYYLSVFKDAELLSETYYPDNAPGAAGSLMMASFRLGGTNYNAFNGGPMYQLTSAFSLMVHCENQAEIDYYWEALGKDGKEMPCGWLEDKFGLSWQIVPASLGQFMNNPNPVKAANIMNAFFRMKKISIPELEAARDKE
jgi:predicted 3-demethylubiquinone-9 3-methyltransferase (glyoxalase superfamily)